MATDSAPRNVNSSSEHIVAARVLPPPRPITPPRVGQTVQESGDRKRVHGSSPISPARTRESKRHRTGADSDHCGEDDDADARGLTPTAPSPAPTVVDVKSPEFWYPDGNVVVRVESTLFRLYRARLAQHCRYFADLFKAPAQDGGDGESESNTIVIDLTQDECKQEEEEELVEWPEMVEGCAVYTITEFSAQDFVHFLSAMDTPFVNAIEAPTEDVVLALIRTGHALGCDHVLTPAKRRLVALWPGHAPPSGRAFSSIRGMEMLRFARKYRLPPSVIKLAYYQILASERFWVLLERRREFVPLSDKEIVCLYRARGALTRVWRELVLTPPYYCNTNYNNPEEGEMVSQCASWVEQAPTENCCVWLRHHKRVAGWYMAFQEDVEAGATDPFGALCLFERKYASLRRKWCEECLGERRLTWQNVSMRWWGMLDDLLDFSYPRR